jgi:hypothetical protein
MGRPIINLGAGIRFEVSAWIHLTHFGVPGKYLVKPVGNIQT